jgi:programmed cell death protein 5
MPEAIEFMSMDEEELEAIRRRKMAELQQAQSQAVAEQQYREQVQAQRQLILRQILTPEARERLGRIELAYPELKENIENQLISLAQSGRVQRQIDDATLRQILERVIPRRREIKIERR